jgi:hypothetical protein
LLTTGVDVGVLALRLALEVALAASPLEACRPLLRPSTVESGVWQRCVLERARASGEAAPSFATSDRGAPPLSFATELDLSALRRQLNGLQQCYERALKQHLTGTTVRRLELTLVVTATGEVERASLTGLADAPSLETCFLRAARRWQLAPTGTPTTTRIPITLVAG